MKTKDELKEEKVKKLDDLLTLAKFAQIESPEQAQAFEKEHPDFFPATWWDSGRAALPAVLQIADPGFDWLRYQQLLREAWKTRFPLDTTVRLSTPSSWTQQMDLIMSGKVYPYQRAIMLMHAEPWRPAHCLRCAKPFAKDAKGRKYCSIECYDPALEAKRRWWEKHGKKQRAQRNKTRKRTARR